MKKNELDEIRARLAALEILAEVFARAQATICGLDQSRPMTRTEFAQILAPYLGSPPTRFIN